jgi:G3E family GTPase
MAGITATIDLNLLRIQWDSHSAMVAICTYHTITKDQLIRLKGVVPLAPRHDRRFRFKPKRSEYRDPTPSEIRAATKRIRATWDDATEQERRVSKTQFFQLRSYSVPDELQDSPEMQPDW